MGQNFFAPLPCALAIGALWDTSKYKKVSCSEPLGVTILPLLRSATTVTVTRTPNILGADGAWLLQWTQRRAVL